MALNFNKANPPYQNGIVEKLAGVAVIDGKRIDLSTIELLKFHQDSTGFDEIVWEKNPPRSTININMFITKNNSYPGPSSTVTVEVYTEVEGKHASDRVDPSKLRIVSGDYEVTGGPNDQFVYCDHIYNDPWPTEGTKFREVVKVYYLGAQVWQGAIEAYTYNTPQTITGEAILSSIPQPPASELTGTLNISISTDGYGEQTSKAHLSFTVDVSDLNMDPKDAGIKFRPDLSGNNLIGGTPSGGDYYTWFGIDAAYYPVQAETEAGFTADIVAVNDSTGQDIKMLWEMSFMHSELTGMGSVYTTSVPFTLPIQK